MLYAVIGLGAAFVLYSIYNAFKYGQSIYECYPVAYLPLVIFVLLGSINPEWRSNENWGYFLTYIPMFALVILPFTIVPVIIAHIVHTIKLLSHPKPNEHEKDKWRIVTTVFFIGGVLMFFPVISFIGFLLAAGACLLTTGVCICRIIHHPHKKSKE